MNLNTLKAFRHEVYASFTRAKDALFNTVDALITETAAHSFAELSLSPAFERRWSSLYEAFEDGRIERERLQATFMHYLPMPAAGQRRLGGIDASTIARPQSKTAADRITLPVPNLPQSRTVPLTVGWQFSTLVVLPQSPSSWCSILDSRRIASHQTAAEVAAEQLREAVARLPPGMRPLLVGDRYYPSASPSRVPSALCRSTACCVAKAIASSTGQRLRARASGAHHAKMVPVLPGPG
jgi:DDE superfamily endonuclease